MEARFSYVKAAPGVFKAMLGLGIRVFELAPPMTRTPLFGGEIRADDVKGIRMMDVSKMVSEAIGGSERDRLDIRPGLSNVLKLMSRVAPRLALKRLSRTADTMLVRASSSI